MVNTYILRSLLFPLCVAFLAPGYTYFPAYERICQSKSLQLMTGISGLLFWFSNIIFDAITSVVPWLIIWPFYLWYYEIGAHAASKDIIKFLPNRITFMCSIKL